MTYKQRAEITAKNGDIIHVGDTVRFYWDFETGLSVLEDRIGTEIVDVVEEIDGELHFTCPGFGSAYAWRYAHECEIIHGSTSDDL